MFAQPGRTAEEQAQQAVALARTEFNNEAAQVTSLRRELTCVREVEHTIDLAAAHLFRSQELLRRVTPGQNQ